MQKIKITLLGGAAVGVGNEQVHFRTEPCLLLFVYLAVHIGRRVPHDELIHAIWPDEKSVSRNRIAATSYLIRKALGHHAAILRAEKGLLSIDPHLAETDLARFLSNPVLEDYIGPPIPYVKTEWADRLRNEVRQLLKLSQPGDIGQVLDVDPEAAGFLCERIRQTAHSDFELAQSLLSRLSEALPLELSRAGSPLWQLRLELADEVSQAKRQALYCAFVSDASPGAIEDSKTATSFGIRGKTGDYLLFNNPVQAALAAREVLEEQSKSRVFLTIVVISPSEPLPLGLRSTMRQLPGGKSYCSWLVKPHLESRMEVGFDSVNSDEKLFGLSWE